MNERQALEAITQIEGMYDKRFTDVAKSKLVQDLSREPAAAMIKAIRKMEEENNYLPTPIVILRAVREQSAIIREDEARREARAHSEAQSKLTRPNQQETKIGKDTCALVRSLMIGKITRREYLEGIRHLDTLYPRAGFAATGSRIQDFYRKKNLDLSRCP